MKACSGNSRKWRRYRIFSWSPPWPPSHSKDREARMFQGRLPKDWAPIYRISMKFLTVDKNNFLVSEITDWMFNKLLNYCLCLFVFVWRRRLILLSYAKLRINFYGSEIWYGDFKDLGTEHRLIIQCSRKETRMFFVYSVMIRLITEWIICDTRV